MSHAAGHSLSGDCSIIVFCFLGVGEGGASSVVCFVSSAIVSMHLCARAAAVFKQHDRVLLLVGKKDGVEKKSFGSFKSRTAPDCRTVIASQIATASTSTKASIR